MKDCDINEVKDHGFIDASNALDPILRAGAQRLLQQAIEQEVEEYLTMHASSRDDSGRRLVVRNGYLPRREIQSGLGPISVSQPRVRDKCGESKYSSALLPPYLRRTPSIDSVLPALYLKGVSTGDFQEALEAILGENAKGLSPTTIVRLKKSWEKEYKDWNKRDLSGNRYVYLWVDGIFFNIRLTSDRPCFLVIIGALPDGRKELVAIHSGYRESKVSWMEAL